MFIFLEEGDAARILDGLWLVGKVSLILCWWWVDFYPGLSRVLKRHLWVLLPHLPLPLWTQESLSKIGNCLGRFIMLDEQLFHTYDKRMAKVMVELDTSKGLPAVLDTTWGDRVLK